MEKVAQFFKVSFEQFFMDCSNSFPELDKNEVAKVYNEIQLPKRATKGSAGYDFFLPMNITIKPKESLQIPTGIRAKIVPGWLLEMLPKSSQGFKFRLQLDNTIGVIDSDYFDAKNEGHIIVQITNDTYEEKIMKIMKGKAFVQGIFLPYGITVDDDTDGNRVGGFGSTKK